LAHAYQRAGRGSDALTALEGQESPGALAFSAELLLHANRLGDAADAAGAAMRTNKSALSAELREALSLGLRGSLPEGELPNVDWLDRLHTSKRLAGIDERPSPRAPLHEILLAAQWIQAPTPSERVTADPHPFVQAFASGTARSPNYPEESVPTRLFGAHGPDFKSGTFIAFVTSCEDRLTYFDAELLAAVDALFETERLEFAFGRGYGLAIERGLPTGELHERVEAINATGVLPFPLEIHVHQPFDVLDPRKHDPPGRKGEDARLARRFAEDLKKHPARKNLNPDDTAPFAKILGAFRGGNPKPERLQALFGEAQKRYGAVGLRALQSFATQAALENKAVAKRIASRRSL
jgi:hypothetical protein